jgi:hypothetical protein
MSANAVSGPVYAPTNVSLDVIAAEVGCNNSTGQFECLRQVKMYDLETVYFNSTANTWFSPIVDSITRWSVADYVKRFEAGLYPSYVPLITGNSNGGGTIFSIVYSGEIPTSRHGSVPSMPMSLIFLTMFSSTLTTKRTTHPYLSRMELSMVTHDSIVL